MSSKLPYTFHIDPSQLAQLKIISSVSRGKPKVSGLIREAIDAYVTAATKDELIADALRRAANKPRLIAVGQNPTTERSK